MIPGQTSVPVQSQICAQLPAKALRYQLVTQHEFWRPLGQTGCLLLWARSLRNFLPRVLQLDLQFQHSEQLQPAWTA